MVGFGLDYACTHIIILAEISSENLLPIRADFVTERDIGIGMMPRIDVWGYDTEFCSSSSFYSSSSSP